VRIGLARPYIYVPKRIAKRKRTRRVPLWWDAGTLNDVTAWKDERTAQDAGPNDPFIASQSKPSFGRPLDRQRILDKFRVACRCLGKERLSEITTHTGRHSFASHALAVGRTLPEVQTALGHSSVAITSLYLHVAVEDDGKIGSLFGVA
jgi:integrase